MSTQNETKCFFIGLGVGVATAVLLAPKAGAETRQLLQNKAAKAVDAANEVLQQGGEAIRQQKENLVAAVQAGKTAFNGSASSNSI